MAANKRPIGRPRIKAPWRKMSTSLYLPPTLVRGIDALVDVNSTDSRLVSRSKIIHFVLVEFVSDPSKFFEVEVGK